MNKCSTNGRSFGKSYKYEIIRIANQFVGNMYKLLPEGQIGKYSIVHKLVTKKDCELELDRMRLSFNFKDYLQLKEGMYTYLMEEDEVWFSDTPTEIFTCLDFLINARGKILIGGLGLCCMVLILKDINKKFNNIKSIDIIEKDKDIISLVYLPLQYMLKRHIEVNVIQDDIFIYKPNKKYNTIFMDIWQDLGVTEEEERIFLENRYLKYLLNNGNIISWKQKIII